VSLLNGYTELLEAIRRLTTLSERLLERAEAADARPHQISVKVSGAHDHVSGSSCA
jgi:hypothetical protein